MNFFKAVFLFQKKPTSILIRTLIFEFHRGKNKQQQQIVLGNVFVDDNGV